MVGHSDILSGNGAVAVLEAQSMKIQRVVRCSMSAELSMAAEAFRTRGLHQGGARGGVL